ncbi:hypothetical protein [Paraglaciecola sp. 2405UD69-4]|uniref:hypothetical protein n=1 Tax=Paraglaciecola sp. 2405UD69-4 TaxID=3391836 RepID=UPI0039C9B3A0
MTDHKEPTEDTLSKLYSKRKSQHPAPASIKHKLLNAQAADKSNTAIFNRISYVAVAASTLLLIGVMLLRNQQFNTPAVAYQTIEIHSLETEASNPLSSESIKNRYAQHYEDYLMQQKTYAQHHQKHAKLTVAGNTWELTTCDNQVMQVSEELITALTEIHQIGSQVNSGDIVEIAFDQNGIILGIQSTSVPLTC